jgi:hypothetical protein
MKLPIDQIIDDIQSNPNLTYTEILEYLKTKRLLEAEAITECFHYAVFYAAGNQISDGSSYLDFKYPDSEI